MHSPSTGTLMHLGLARDVTERKRAENALRQNEERLRLALRAAQMVTFEWDVHSGRILWADGAEQMFGFPPGVFPKTYQEMEARIHPEDLPLHRDEVARALENRTSFQIDFRIVWPDGSVRWISRHGHFHFDEAGEPLRMVGVVMDVTARKRLETDLRESNRRFEETLNSVRDLFVSFDAEWRYTFLNEKAAAFTGAQAHELIGKNVWEVFPDAIGNPNWKAMHEVAATQKPITYEGYYDHMARWYEHRVYPTHHGIVLLGTDVTARSRWKRNFGKVNYISADCWASCRLPLTPALQTGRSPISTTRRSISGAVRRS